MESRPRSTAAPAVLSPTPRRRFLRDAAVGAAALGLAPAAAASAAAQETKPAAPSGFKLRYAPALGMFERSAGRDPVEQIRFMADQGFRAMFDNGLADRTPQVQEAIGRELDRRKMLLGPFVAYADLGAKSMVLRDPAVRTMLETRFKRAVETAKRSGARWALAVPGRLDESQEPGYQTASIVEHLRRAADICEPAGLTIVIEPLNLHDHPGLFLTQMPQAYAICKAVGRPSVKIIDDIYHQQITEGNIIPNIDRCFDEIASFHVGDTPGRNEPGTGEINYRNVFRHLASKRYDGAICMEHGASRPGKDGEAAIIAAYRNADDFTI